MKTSLDLPDDLVRDLRVAAATEGRRMKDIVEESLRRTLAGMRMPERPSVRDIPPVSVGRILDLSGPDDRMEDMLDGRGHRY